MKYFGMLPVEWGQLKRIDKRILHYWRVMEQFYTDIAETSAKQRADASSKASQLLRKRAGR